MNPKSTYLTRLANFGVHNELPYLLKKRIQFSNVFSCFLLIFVFLMSLGAFQIGGAEFAVSFWVYMIIPTLVMVCNSLHLHRWARGMFIPVTLLFFTIASGLSHASLVKNGVDLGILSAYMFRYYAPSAVVALLVLLDYKRETKLFIASTVVSLVLVSSHFVIIEWMGINFDELPREKLGIATSEFLIWTDLIVILAEVFFLMNINNTYERQFLAQNTELETQKEEILTINDQLTEQKDEIVMQRDVLEKVHGNLMSSINYAQRIQNALLPRRDLMEEALPAHFILFRPRDVVSGDFYWAAEREEKFFWICGDCTGHGVPGAFMTVVGMNLLHQIIMEEREDDPSTILLRLNRRIGQALRHDETQEDKKVPDGMDMALVVVDRKQKTFQFAGAKRPLYFVPKGGELEQIKGSKHPIGGGYTTGKIFETHTFTYDAGDRIYLFSDGYPDQYGGADHRKFMVKRFRERIKEMQPCALARQEDLLEESLDEWQGATRQTDDILVMGMEF